MGAGSICPRADSPYAAIIDPELGRIALPAPAAGSAAPELTVSYYYGFNADMGGGEYSRGDGFTVSDPAWILPYPDTASVPRYADLQQASELRSRSACAEWPGRGRDLGQRHAAAPTAR